MESSDGIQETQRHQENGQYLELRSICKSFGPNLVVDHISLTMPKGEFLTLLGPSGCGKTTTLRMVAGFVTPTEGEVYIKGKKVNDKPAYVRNTGMVFQSYALFPHMTVYDNIAYGLKMRSYDKGTIKEKVKDTLELVRLPGLEERYPKQLSGGQQQRIALARALVIEPDVLLLDEPLSNLDLKLRQQMRLEIKTIQKRVGITTIYVTHDQGEALVMSDRLVVINKGKVVQTGSPADVYERPRTKFVADFIGEANYIEGTVSSIGESSIEVSMNGYTVFASSDQGMQFKENEKIGMCIRPERIQVSRTGMRERNAFRGTVEEVVYVGSMVRYQVRVGDAKLTVEQRIQSLKDIFQVNDEVVVNWSDANTILLPLR